MFVRLDLIFLVVILSSNGYFGNGHPIHNEINSSEIELLKADNAKLWKELEKMKEKALTENCQMLKTKVTGGKYFD